MSARSGKSRKNHSSKIMAEVFYDTQLCFSNYNTGNLPPTRQYTLSALPAIPERTDRTCPVTVVNADTLGLFFIVR